MPQRTQDFSAPFFEEKERGRQQMNQEAAYAQQVAESLGYFTPELQHRALAPLGKNVTAGENLLTSPIRGLGKLFGNEAMQGFGAPEAFDLGQAQPAPMAPNIPKGTSPEVREALEGMAASLGLQMPSQKGQVPDVPSEISGVPKMKTKQERQRQSQGEAQMWKIIADNIQTKEDRQKAQAEIERMKAQTEQARALAANYQRLATEGPDPTKWSLIKKETEAEWEAGNPGVKYSDTAALYNTMSKQPSATIQAYELSLARGYISKETSLVDFKGAWERADWDPIKYATQRIASNPMSMFLSPEEFDEKVKEATLQSFELAKELDRRMVQSTGKGLYGTEFPQELINLGVTEDMLPKLQAKYGIKEKGTMMQMLLMLARQIRDAGGQVSIPEALNAQEEKKDAGTNKSKTKK